MDYKPRVGGVFEPSRQFSLVSQDIRVNKKGSFHVKFPNIWESYKLPRVKDKTVYDSWLSNQMQFWQNQLNFAVWCATTGCGVTKESFHHENPMIKSVLRFHAYYQIRRILTEMSCPLPAEASFNPLNNGIDTFAYERICAEFGVSPTSNWRQKYDYSNGMGSVRYYLLRGLRSKPTKVLENGKNYDPSQDWTVFIPASGKFGAHDQHRYKIEYIEQLFDHDPGITDVSIRKGDYMAAIGSFVDDEASGFTRAGISRINDSIRTLAWAILGAQAQTRSSILGTGRAFDAQKQFLANVEDSIESAVDLPSSIDRYQSTLQYARSKLDFVVGRGLYMLPSDMDLHVGTLNGYNNLIQIATDDMDLGYNAEVNEETSGIKSLENGDFDFQPKQNERSETSEKKVKRTERERERQRSKA